MPDNPLAPIVVEAPAHVIVPETAEERTELSRSPTTTPEQDRSSAGQRAINLIWETTQMRIALSVIWSSLMVGVILSAFGKWLGSADIQLAAVVFLFGVANLVTGFYFGRTNHARSGGVGGDSAGHR